MWKQRKVLEYQETLTNGRVYVSFFHSRSTICDRNWLRRNSERSITITRLGALLFIYIMMNRSSNLLLVVIDVTESHPIHGQGY